MDRKEKIKQAGILKHGSEERWRQSLRENGLKARRDTPRGFAKIDPERVKEISKLGVEARKRNAENS